MPTISGRFSSRRPSLDHWQGKGWPEKLKIERRTGERGTTNYTMIVIFFTLQGAFGAGGMHAQYPAYLSERFPTEVRATAGGFVYHQGAIFGGLVGPILAYLATSWQLGFAIPMLIGTTVACVSLVLASGHQPGNPGEGTCAGSSRGLITRCG
jgi:hypothetical protein